MTKAFAYLRVSGPAQIFGDGFPRQLEAVTKFAPANGYEVERVFEERGVCGATELENREALQEMIEAMKETGVRIVIIERLDRLARDLMVQETIIGDFRKQGFEIVSTVEPDLCSDDPTRKLMRQIMGAIAEYDRAMIVGKLRGARQRMKARDGRCEGVKPYGLRAGETEVLAIMKKYHALGMHNIAIAERLNSDGILPRKGGRWNPIVVGRILKRSAA